MFENINIARSFEVTLARGKTQSSCTPEWMYNIGEAFVGLSAADELPDGYATSVGYGERFRNGEFLPLFSHYPLLIYLLILVILVTICGIAYAVYRWRVGAPLYRYLHNEISTELSVWFCMCYVLVVITCVFLLFSIAIMFTANKNIQIAKDERAWRLKLADESINEIIRNMDNVDFASPLKNLDQLSTKFHRAIEKKAQPYLGESLRSVNNLDIVNYKSDVNELLETFAHCNAYMLHFLDSWRYYDTNATRFARIVDTMESRKALQAVRRVREDFANVVYKVMQQNRAFYNYYRELETLSHEMVSKHVKEKDKGLQFATTLDKNFKNVENKLKALGTKLQERANKIYELKENLSELPKGAGYIEFSEALLTFGYFVNVVMLLIVFLALLFMPLWYIGSQYCRKCKWIGSILPLTTAAFIFVFYLVFVLAIMYYFLHGMVAQDGVCDGKHIFDSGRSNIIDDCISNAALYENETHTSAESDYDTGTSEIEAALREIESLPKRVKRAKSSTPSSAEDFERFRINKTIIQDIYVEMLKVSVYAPKNIEPFGLIWHANRLSKNKALQALNCTHAIGNTMAVSLHGQVASEMDKLYRTTWRVEALLQDLPTQLKANNDDTGDFHGLADLSKNLRSIFSASKEQLRRSMSLTGRAQQADCKPVAQLYKALKMPACECLVPSMNIFWFGAFVAICLLLLLLALILCLEEMIRRSSLLYRRSKNRTNSTSLSQLSQRDRGLSRTRSSSRPGTSHSTRNETPYSTRNNTPYSTRAGTPHSTRPSSPYSNRLDTPYSTTRATTPYSSHPDTPYTSRPDSPHSSRRGTPHTSHISPHRSNAGTPHSTRARSNERTPTRGTSLALKLPPENAPFLVDYQRFGLEDPFVEQFTERLSRRDMLPRHLQRKQNYPSTGQRDTKDNFTFESYPEMPPKVQQSRSLERKPQKRKEPRNVWKNEAFRYPGPAGSYLSTIQPFSGPRSISKTLEQRDRSQPSERKAKEHHREPKLIAQRSTNEALGEKPTTSGAKPKIKLPPGKVGVVVCPCGCGKPSKIYGTKQDIERIKKAGRVCIAKRGQQLRDKRLRPLASVVELKGNEEGNEDMA